MKRVRRLDAGLRPRAGRSRPVPHRASSIRRSCRFPKSTTCWSSGMVIAAPGPHARTTRCWRRSGRSRLPRALLRRRARAARRSCASASTSATSSAALRLVPEVRPARRRSSRRCCRRRPVQDLRPAGRRGRRSPVWQFVLAVAIGRGIRYFGEGAARASGTASAPCAFLHDHAQVDRSGWPSRRWSSAAAGCSGKRRAALRSLDESGRKPRIINRLPP